MEVLEQDQPLGRSRRRFSEEFEVDVLVLMLDAGSAVVQAAGDLGVRGGRRVCIGWGDRAGLRTAERAELARLRKRCA